MADVEVQPPKQIVFENTYQLEPTQEQRFQQHKVAHLLRALLVERLAGQAYDPVRGSQLAKQLADDIRERVKALGFSRHKLVVQVTISEKKGQAMTMISRGLWDAQTDGHACEIFQNESLVCQALVFATYFS